MSSFPSSWRGERADRPADWLPSDGPYLSPKRRIGYKRGPLLTPLVWMVLAGSAGFGLGFTAGEALVWLLGAWS